MSKRAFSLNALMLLGAFAAATTVATAQTINLPANESPTSGFGKGATETFGQTFKAPTGFTTLQSFSFWLSNDRDLQPVNAAALQFRAYVMAWDNVGGKAQGSALYTSAVRTGPTSASQRYDFTVPGLALAANAQYVAFLSVSGLFGNIGSNDAYASIETTLNGTYTGGQAVFTDNDDDLSALTAEPWLFGGGLPEYQTHFAASFTAAAVVVPEPSSLVLLITGSVIMLVVAGKRKRV